MFFFTKVTILLLKTMDSTPLHKTLYYYVETLLFKNIIWLFLAYIISYFSIYLMNWVSIPLLLSVNS